MSNSSEIADIIHQIAKESGLDSSGIASVIMSVCVGVLLFMKIYSWCKKKNQTTITSDKIIELVETVKAATAATAATADTTTADTAVKTEL